MRRPEPCGGPPFAPLGRWTAVDRRAVREALRGFFAAWGLPQARRGDNGPPWGSWGDLPPELALWVRGLGGDRVWHRPHHSRDNAVIARAPGVCQCGVAPETCADPPERQARLDGATTLQRETDPAVAGQSRLVAFPAVATGGRPSDPAPAEAHGDETRVWAAVARGVWRRHVAQVGRSSLDHRAVGVGRRWAGATVTARLLVREADPRGVLTTTTGEIVGEPPAPESHRERILSLTVSHRRPRRTTAQPPVPEEGQPYSR